MGNSTPSSPLPLRLTVNDGCPLIPYERQSVQEVISNALHLSSSSSSSSSSLSWSTILPIVLIDIIIDYSGIINGRHIITFSRPSKVSIGWISSNLPLRQGTLGPTAKTATSTSGDRPGWRSIYGVFPSNTYNIHHVHHINNYIYIICDRDDSTILMRCHAQQLFASAFSDIIPSYYRLPLLLTWNDLKPAPRDAISPNAVHSISCVWKRTRLFLACQYYSINANPDNCWYHYYDTITNEWHVMPKIPDFYYGAAEAIVLYNDYLFFGNDYNWMLYNEATKTWLKLKIGSRLIRWIVSAPEWLTSRSLSLLVGSHNVAPTSNGHPPTKSIIIVGIISKNGWEENTSHQLSYYIIDTHDGVSTMITPTMVVASAADKGITSSVNESSSDWKIPEWYSGWPSQPFHLIDDHWLLLLAKSGKRTGVVSKDRISNGSNAWKWYESCDDMSTQMFPSSTLFCPFIKKT
jgi:hypothetical protein